MTSKERIELRKWAMDHAFAYSGKSAKINDIVDMANGLLKWAIKIPRVPGEITVNQLTAILDANPEEAKRNGL